MIYHTDPKTGTLKPMSNAEIKREIMQIYGFSTTQQYQKAYDQLRNRVRNYETIIGAKTPLKVNEVMLRMQRRLDRGEALTAEQQSIARISSSSPATFKKQYEAGRTTIAQERIAREGLVGEDFLSNTGAFAGLLQKSAITRNAYTAWLNEVVGHEILRDEQGRIVYDEKGMPMQVEILRSARVTAKEINAFLSNQAKDLHARQKRTIESNRAFYSGHRAKPDTD